MCELCIYIYFFSPGQNQNASRCHNTLLVRHRKSRSSMVAAGFPSRHNTLDAHQSKLESEKQSPG